MQERSLSEADMDTIYKAMGNGDLPPILSQDRSHLGSDPLARAPQMGQEFSERRGRLADNVVELPAHSKDRPLPDRSHLGSTQLESAPQMGNAFDERRGRLSDNVIEKPSQQKVETPDRSHLGSEQLAQAPQMGQQFDAARQRRPQSMERGEQDSRGSTMVEQDQPKLETRPDKDIADPVDREAFDQKWEKEIDMDAVYKQMISEMNKGQGQQQNRSVDRSHSR